MRKQIRAYSNDKDLVHRRRKQIVAKGIRVFLENGYQGSTMRQLAKASGMSEGNLYRYIGSKEDILHLICSMSGPEELDDLKNLANKLSHSSTTIKKILRECIKRYFKHSDTFQERNIFFNREINHFSHEDRQILLQSQTDFVRLFEELIVKGINAEEFKTDSPLLSAHNIVIIGFEWGLRRWFLKQHFTLEEYTNMNTELFFNAIGANKSSVKVKRQDTMNPNLPIEQSCKGGMLMEIDKR